MKDERSSDEKQMQKDAARDERKLPGTERLLRQFLTLETGQGKSREYRRGYEFNFEWTDAARAEVMRLMDSGLSFETAFEQVKPFSHCEVLPV